ncbi:MAG: helix-turn-helix domain-containing protein, partial [Chloroflexi bacterium]|nr:helix-turn-helix domain-containing protein [Chloroflexota bacterium]
MDETTLSTFGELLKAFRKQRNLTQHELASRLSVHRNTVGKWENGTFLPESKTIVLELASQLHLDTSDTRRLLEASLTALSPYWQVPYQRNPFFTGRSDVLQQLHEALAQKGSALISQSYALSGLGGIGKTQTALEYAYRYGNDYAAVFWISAETYESIVSSFVAIAELLNLPEKQDKEQDRVLAAVLRWLTAHNAWLIIFDNVEDLEVVKAALPASRCGSLLFTSRRKALDFSAQTLDL